MSEFGNSQHLAHNQHGSQTMEKKPIRIELTDEQKQQIREATGKDASAIELSAEELESRVSPMQLKSKVLANKFNISAE
jgi:hypothetical protein